VIKISTLRRKFYENFSDKKQFHSFRGNILEYLNRIEKEIEKYHA